MVGNYIREYQRYMINKTIHQLWGGTSLIPSGYQRCVDTMVESNPAYEHILWSDSRAINHTRDIIQKHDVPIDEYEHDIARWDMLRLLVIYKYGGVCCDLDMTCQTGMDPSMFTNTCGFLYEYNICPGTGGFLHNTVMYCEPHASFIEFILRWSRYYLKKVTGLPKRRYVSAASGADMLTGLYHMFPDKSSVNLIPSQTAYTHMTHERLCGW